MHNTPDPERDDPASPEPPAPLVPENPPPAPDELPGGADHDPDGNPLRHPPRRVQPAAHPFDAR